MVASPEICRANGRLSRGPRSKRGKAIAAQNATKHGLLSSKPPLVMGEDLESFQGIVQGLTEEYRPQTATDHLLIQQVAMGWQRLHRLWGVEAATATLAMIRLERAAKYPAASLTTLIEESEQVQSPHSPVVLKTELMAARELTCAVEEWLYALPKRVNKQWLVSQEGQATVAQLQKILSEFRGKLPALSVPPPGSDQFPSSLCSKLTYAAVSLEFLDRKSRTQSAGNLREIAQTVIDGCLSRIEEIDAILSDQARLEQAEQQAAIASRSIVPEPEKLARYERHINRTLYQPLDKLESIRQQRKQAGSIGSLGRTTATFLTNAKN